MGASPIHSTRKADLWAMDVSNPDYPKENRKSTPDAKAPRRLGSKRVRNGFHTADAIVITKASALGALNQMKGDRQASI